MCAFVNNMFPYYIDSMVFHKLGAIARHIGRKAVEFSENALGKIGHFGKIVHSAAGKIPVVGGMVQRGLETAYNTRIPGLGLSARDAYEGGKGLTHLGRQVFSDNPQDRAEGYQKALSGSQ